jgi:caffeoyl-CoA O-methyltransferase
MARAATWQMAHGSEAYGSEAADGGGTRDGTRTPLVAKHIKTIKKLDISVTISRTSGHAYTVVPMTRRTEQISLHLNAYLNAHSSPPDAVLRELANETADLFPTETALQIAPEQGTFMTLLTQLTGATSAIEIGTFTGYSSICIARGLAPGGTLLCCDISEEWTWVAKKYWEKAGLEDRIELRLGPAMDTLLSLPEEKLFDLAFIDADKSGYLGYWRQVVPRVRAGGLIMVDNTFSHGRVIDAGNDNPAVIAIRDFNDHAAADDRVDLVMVPIGDGLTVARKK